MSCGREGSWLLVVKAASSTSNLRMSGFIDFGDGNRESVRGRGLLRELGWRRSDLELGLRGISSSKLWALFQANLERFKIYRNGEVWRMLAVSK